MQRPLFFWLFQALFACWCLAAGARELEWRALEVDARLDDEGHLHVSERHEMVFTGDWNGGERRFRVADDQSMWVQSIARLDSSGSWVPLTEGSLERVDHYKWLHRENILRWRLRQESEPVFDHTVFVHRIDYVLSGALESRGKRRWTLDHDFAFRERPGNIERFELRLQLDESWHGPRPSPIGLQRGPLDPEQSVRVRLPLEYTGTRLREPPSAEAEAWEWLRVDVWMPFLGWSRTVRRALTPDIGLWLGAMKRGATADVRSWVAALFATLLGGLAHVFFRRGRERCQLTPLRAEADIDAAWIEQHILPHEPEVIGMVYDRVIGSAVLMAIVARLEREGKLTSKVENGQLELQLRVPRDTFVGYERDLVNVLFFAGDHTSASMIRSHYKTFNPAEALRGSLAPKVDAVLGPAHRDPEDSPYPVKLTAFAAGVALLHSGVSASKRLDSSLLGLILFLGVVVAFPLAAVRARQFRDRLDPPLREARFLLRWFVGFGAAVVGFAMLAPYMGPLDFLLHFGSALTLALLVVWSGWPRLSAEGVALRKRVAEARRYFQAQLRTSNPQLDDAWYPYLIALGLAPELDGWLAAFGGEPERKERERRSRSGLSMSSPVGSTRTERQKETKGESEPTRWTGGGGQFGGAGASGSWDSAVGGLTSTVNTSSSSGSSSSSRSGRSGSSSARQSTPRSGGGGGGGW